MLRVHESVDEIVPRQAVVREETQDDSLLRVVRAGLINDRCNKSRVNIRLVVAKDGNDRAAIDQFEEAA
jgi:hypothetical protein